MSITPEEIERLRGLCRDATEGPWTIEPHGNIDALYAGRDEVHHGLNLADIASWDANGEANAAFIAAAREALPRLLDEIERMQKEKRSDLRSVRIATQEDEIEELKRDLDALHCDGRRCLNCDELYVAGTKEDEGDCPECCAND